MDLTLIEHFILWTAVGAATVGTVYGLVVFFRSKPGQPTRGAAASDGYGNDTPAILAATTMTSSASSSSVTSSSSDTSGSSDSGGST